MLLRVVLLLLFSVATLLQGDKRSSDPPKDHPPKAVKADTEFIRQWAELAALESSIKQLEDADGITKMRELAQGKVVKLRQWMKEHQVEGWTYDERDQTFTETKKPGPAPQ